MAQCVANAATKRGPVRLSLKVMVACPITLRACLCGNAHGLNWRTKAIPSGVGLGTLLAECRLAGHVHPSREEAVMHLYHELHRKI